MTLEIFIPENATCFLKVGNKVDFKELFYEQKQSKDLEIDIAQKLNIPPKKIFKYLKKFVGDTIEKGNIIAQVKSFFSNSKITSPVDGTLKEVNHQNGKIVITCPSDQPDQVIVFFKGEIVEIKKKLVKVKAGQSKDFEIKKSNKSFGGRIVFLKTQTLTNELVENNIIVAQEISPFDQIKLEALGTQGFVTNKPLEEKTSLAFAEIKNWSDAEKNISDYSYCLVNKESSRIYFYK